MNEQHISITDAVALEVFNLAIVEELIREINPDATDDTIAKVWQTCHGNPWNAAIMYKLLEHANTL